jgi:hypothetical protein
MPPIFPAFLIALPTIALGTWLYMRRRALSPRTRIALIIVLFLIVLVSGPAILLMWYYDGIILKVRAAGYTLLGWLMAVFGVGSWMLQLCRRRGVLAEDWRDLKRR